MTGEEPRVDSHQLPSLAGPLSKLRRAHVHLRELYGELNAYTAEPRHRVISDHTAVGEDRIYKMRLEVLEPLGNPRWGLLVGDFVHNLRASLDHLVWQLVLLNGGRPTRSNQFPICSSRERYWESSGGQRSIRERTLAGMAARHREKIDSVQPFCAPFADTLDHEFHVLAVLARLSNIDKHQLIMSALVSVGRWLWHCDHRASTARTVCRPHRNRNCPYAWCNAGGWRQDRAQSPSRDRLRTPKGGSERWPRDDVRVRSRLGQELRRRFRGSQPVLG